MKNSATPWRHYCRTNQKTLIGMLWMQVLGNQRTRRQSAMSMSTVRMLKMDMLGIANEWASDSGSLKREKNRVYGMI
ncbi:hypothetical protein Leryth_001338 [Lithospermum erythrorhizon]|nr:hypothetical protein Leryth_001338 [Lithospermum erythrorhizon]